MTAAGFGALVDCYDAAHDAATHAERSAAAEALPLSAVEQARRGELSPAQIGARWIVAIEDATQTARDVLARYASRDPLQSITAHGAEHAPALRASLAEIVRLLTETEI